MLLENKVAIVSGVGPGMGQATAKALAREGATVALAARSADYLEQVAKEIEAAGGTALPVPTDLVDPEQCQNLVDRTVAEFGGLDILVNAAFKPDVFRTFEEVDLEEWRKIFDVNVFGTLQLTQAAIPSMKDRGRGSIVFVNTMEIRKPRQRLGGYASSKGALLVAARVLAYELGKYKIRVNSVVPGWMWGPPVQGYVDYRSQRRGVAPEEIIAEITAEIPLGEIPRQEDCAEAVVFFASDLSKAITGQALDTNGGEVFD
jgi:NAD(P)-dependent dehydrogenase (short-subunit alcohol dehydrogenase family)